MAKKKTNKGVSALMKINRRAKQIVAYSGGSYRVAHKKASAEYRADHKPKARKKSVGKVAKKKTTYKKKPTYKKKVGKAREVGKDKYDNKRVNITVGDISRSQHLNAVRKGYQETIAAWMIKEMNADTARKKTKIRRYISKLKTQLRKLESI
jgi:hypothetical protein